MTLASDWLLGADARVMREDAGPSQADNCLTYIRSDLSLSPTLHLFMFVNKAIKHLVRWGTFGNVFVNLFFLLPVLKCLKLSVLTRFFTIY